MMLLPKLTSAASLVEANEVYDAIMADSPLEKLLDRNESLGAGDA